MVKLNFILVGFVVIYFLQMVLDFWMERLNVRHMRQWSGSVLRIFEGFVDSAGLSRITSYSADKSRLGIFSQLVSDVVMLALILTGFMAFLEHTLQAAQIPPLIAGLIFFMVPGFILFLLDLPFDYFNTFVLEERFGFNRSTLGIWVLDHLKSGVVSAFLFSVLLIAVLWVIRVSPQHWWIWGFLVVSAVQVLLAILYPRIIAPLFNKFEPVRDELLAKRITKLMEDNGIRVRKILQMNAGLRSRHTNAYFTGLGKTKQIVLYDTLIESHSHDEIISVLAHEVGHFKGKHILKQLVFFEFSLLIVFYLTYCLLDWPLLYATFGFDRLQPYAGLFIIGIFWQKAGFFLQPIYMSLSRRFERQADAFAMTLLGTSRPLVTALKRMAADNLSNLAPHPIYVWFNYSHPPLVERINRLTEGERSSLDPMSGGEDVTGVQP